MKLSEQQFIFSRNVYKLLGYIFEQELDVTFGECYRTLEQSQWNVEHGLGILLSKHRDREAIDLNIWKNGVLLKTKEEYAQIGEYWKSLNPLNRWGGDFTRKDDPEWSDPGHFEQQ